MGYISNKLYQQQVISCACCRYFWDLNTSRRLADSEYVDKRALYARHANWHPTSLNKSFPSPSLSNIYIHIHAAAASAAAIPSAAFGGHNGRISAVVRAADGRIQHVMQGKGKMYGVGQGVVQKVDAASQQL
eukprot:1159891-Pelagomonas_calceolata.AAC.2